MRTKRLYLKFYSQRAIGIATFFGGPLAACYLVRENYLVLNKPDEAKKALLYGLLATVAVLGFILLTPEDVMEKIPNQIFPLIYTAVIYYVVESTQGETLKLHEKFGNEFISGWKAALVGFGFSESHSMPEYSLPSIAHCSWLYLLERIRV